MSFAMKLVGRQVCAPHVANKIRERVTANGAVANRGIRVGTRLGNCPPTTLMKTRSQACQPMSKDKRYYEKCVQHISAL